MDGVEQRNERAVRHFILTHGPAAGEKLHLRLGKIVEDRIAHQSGARKLAVQMGAREIALLGRSGEDLFHIIYVADGEITVHSGKVPRTAAGRRIDHVLHITLFREVVSPSWASVGGLLPVS